MERLLHYVWQHRLLPLTPLLTDSGETVDLIDPGLPNPHAGPDFFNAKVKVGDTLWVGNVEIHRHASDWFRHGHHSDNAYNNVVLHVCHDIDDVAVTADGHRPPQLALEIPPMVAQHYEELLAENAFPPCHRIVPSLAPITVEAWLDSLAAERLEDKTTHIARLLDDNGGDWEQTTFVLLARNFGFGVNADALELWARHLPLRAVAKHRDDLFQVEAFFLGQAGLLADDRVAPERRDEYFVRLQHEYAFLQRKFSLRPIPPSSWRFLRLRPQNFPYIRLSQLAVLYHRCQADFSRLVGAETPADLRQLLQTEVSPYWQTHFSFGKVSAPQRKTLQKGALDLLLINTAVPLLFAYGRRHDDEACCERATALLEAIAAESNHITRSWAAAGITPRNAADSQALIQLQQHYCQPKDCLRCRFGAAYLRQTK